MTDLATSPLGEPVMLGCRWTECEVGMPACGHGFTAQAPAIYNWLTPKTVLSYEGLDVMRDRMRRAVEALETGYADGHLVDRGVALQALVGALRDARGMLDEIRGYALSQQYQTLDSELPKDYRPLVDPRARRSKVPGGAAT